MNAQRDTFFVFDPSTGKAVRWNKAFKEMSGYSDEEMSILKAPETYYREDELKQLVIATEVVEQGGTTTNELNLITKEGNLIPFEYIASGIFDDDANLKYIVAIGRDITERKKNELQLKKSEEKFRGLFENSTSGIAYHRIVYDSLENPVDYIITDVNPLYEKILSLKKEDVINKMATEIYQVESAPYLDIFSKVAETQESYSFEIFFPPMNKYFRISVISKEKGEFITIFDDITREKESEQKLKKSEKKYRLLFDKSPIGINLFTIDRKIIDSNDAMEKITGYSIEEFKNLEASSIYADPNDRVKLKKLLQEFGKVRDFETKFKKKNNTEYLGSINLDLIELDGVKIIQSSLRDITDLKKAEQKLKESEEKFRTITEESFLAISIIQDNVIKYANQKMADLMGYSTEEMLNWKPGGFMKVVAPDYVEIIREQVKKKQLGDPEVIVHYSIHAVKKSGELFWVDNISKTIMYEGRPADLVTQIDMTERKKAQEELTRLSKLKSELLTRTSHELKTPAMHIKGYADLLLHKYKDNLGIDELQIISHIKKGVLRLETIIYDILHKAELDSGQGELNKIIDNLSSIIELSVRELKSFAALRGHSIILNIHNNITISFDKDQIRHAINNLITNAIKYTPLNGIIEISSTITDDFITIAVHDNGIGFTKKEKERLFSQFGKIERYGQGYDIITEGTGLGLHIAKKIIDLHGGKIWVESGGRNKGSTFYFSLPKVII